MAAYIMGIPDFSSAYSRLSYISIRIFLVSS